MGTKARISIIILGGLAVIGLAIAVVVVRQKQHQRIDAGRTPATLTIQSVPTDAFVTLIALDQPLTKENERVAFTPSTFSSLTPGEYEMLLSKEGWCLLDQSITVTSGQQQTLTLALTTPPCE